MNQVTIRITTPLRKFVGGQAEVPVSADTVGQALNQLSEHYPDMRGRLTESDGSLRTFIQLHVGKTPIRQLGGLAASLNTGDVLSVTSPFSGG
jgi:molybdopterin converting factor small subunit